MTAMDASEQSLRVAEIQRWRRSVVRGWVVTMIAALVAWGATAAWLFPPAVEVAAGLMLLVLGGCAYWNTRRGRCPRCNTSIRFEPRIELPRNCRSCGIPFSPDSGGSDDEIRM